MTVEEKTSTAEVIRDLARIQFSEVNGTPIAFLPMNVKLEQLPQLRTLPQRVQQTIVAHDVAGFIAYVARFKEATSLVFAALEPQPRLLSIIDYHGPATGTNFAIPQFCQHRVATELPRSEEWKRWTLNSNERFSQKQFGEFLQDNLADIVEPAPGKLLATALNLSSLRNVEFKSSQRLQDGTVAFSYTEDEKVSTDARLPEKIKIGIAVFKGGDRYNISARLRYTIRDGALTIWYELERPDLVIDQAYSDTIDKVATETGLPVIRGAVGHS